MVNNGVAFKNGKFITIDNAKGERSFRVECAFGTWDNEPQAVKFYTMLGVQGLKILGIEEDPDQKVTRGRITQSIKTDGIKAIYTYSVKRTFAGIDDEDKVDNLYEWVQHGALDQAKGIKQGKLS